MKANLPWKPDAPYIAANSNSPAPPFQGPRIPEGRSRPIQARSNKQHKHCRGAGLRCASAKAPVISPYSRPMSRFFESTKRPPSTPGRHPDVYQPRARVSCRTSRTSHLPLQRTCHVDGQSTLISRDERDRAIELNPNG